MAEPNIDDMATEDFDESSASDWDADLPDAPEQDQPTAELYTMQSSGGMVTITPAGKKAKFTSGTHTTTIRVKELQDRSDV